MQFTLELHENGSITAQDQRWNQRGGKVQRSCPGGVHQTIWNRWASVVNQPATMALGKSWFTSLRRYRKPGPFYFSIRRQPAKPPIKEISTSIPAITTDVPMDYSIIGQVSTSRSSEHNANHVALKENTVTACRYNEDALEKVGTIAAKQFTKKSLPWLKPGKARKGNQSNGGKTGPEKGFEGTESWNWKLLSGSAWIASLCFWWVALLSIIHGKFEWQLLLPWAGFLMVYVVSLWVYRSRKIRWVWLYCRIRRSQSLAERSASQYQSRLKQDTNRIIAAVCSEYDRKAHARILI